MESLGKIITIIEVRDVNLMFDEYSSYDGYVIKTNSHTYSVLIDNGQSCCENWGYLSSNDNFCDFTGKELIEVYLTDVALKTQDITDVLEYGLDEGGIQFINFKFSDGNILQFAVYNAHNGYYGHEIIIAKDTEIICEDIL